MSSAVITIHPSELETRALSISERAKSIEVHDQASYEQAARFLLDVITPMIAAYFLKGHGHVEKGDGWAMRVYMRTLRWTLKHRWTAVVASVAAFAGTLFMFSILPATFQPPQDRDRSTAMIEMVPGTTLEQTARVVKHVEEILRAQPIVTSAYSTTMVGSGRVSVELASVPLEPFVQLLEICRSAVPVTDRVQLEPPTVDAEPPQQLGVELDHLRVERRVVGAHSLDVQLPELAELSALRRGVPVHRPDQERLHRLRRAVEPVLDVRARDRGRALGSQRQRAVTAVRERVHLLLDDVGALPRRAREELGVLEERSRDPPVAVRRTDVFGLAKNPLPQRLLRGQDVLRASRRLELHEARSSSRNGLRSSSAPRVVSGPWPE